MLSHLSISVWGNSAALFTESLHSRCSGGSPIPRCCCSNRTEQLRRQLVTTDWVCCLRREGFIFSAVCFWQQDYRFDSIFMKFKEVTRFANNEQDHFRFWSIVSVNELANVRPAHHQRCRQREQKGHLHDYL